MPVTILLASFLISQAQQPSPVLALFDQGISWQTFLTDVQAQRATWEANASRAPVPADLVERVRKAAADLKLLVVAEANCSDSVQSVPYVARLATEAGIPLRIVRKAAASAVIDRHRTPDGRTATPTVILIRGGEDAGAWVERPAALQAWFIAHADLTSSERLARKTGWYVWDRGESTLAEIVALVEKTAR